MLLLLDTRRTHGGFIEVYSGKGIHIMLQIVRIRPMSTTTADHHTKLWEKTKLIYITSLANRNSYTGTIYRNNLTFARVT